MSTPVYTINQYTPFQDSIIKFDLQVNKIPEYAIYKKM